MGKKIIHPELPDHVNKFEDCVIERNVPKPKNEDIISEADCKVIYAKKVPKGNPTCYYYIYIPTNGGYERIAIPYPC